MRYVALGVALIVPLTLAAQDSPPLVKQRVTYPNGDVTLVGFVFKPAGKGPFPTIIWNHGSEPNPGAGTQFDSVAAVFVPHGYVVFAPTRRGHGESTGDYIGNVLSRARSTQGNAAAMQIMKRLLETQQLDDQIAGIEYAKKLPFVGIPGRSRLGSRCRRLLRLRAQAMTTTYYPQTVESW